MRLRPIQLSAVLTALLALAGCGRAGQPAAPEPAAAAGNAVRPTFHIGAIPDQNAATLNRQFGAMAEYLSQALGLKVEYVPSVDYAAVVTAFERGDIDLAWFGGLTAVQAIAAVPGSEAIAQRPRDAEFHSVFIVQSNLPVHKLEDLRGLTFTFGSESSTSGHLMPRYYLMQAGIDPDRDFAVPPNFSGSHDKTYKLVESGAFQAGALNEAVWEAAVKEGKVDTRKVRAFYTTPPYHDYNWTIRAGVDAKFGPGTKERVRKALLSMGPDQKAILDLFATDRFIETRNENYEAIRRVAEQLGILRP